MINPNFDPLKILNDLTQAQLQSSELSQEICRVLNEHTQHLNKVNEVFNDINQRLCQVENTMRYLDKVNEQ